MAQNSSRILSNYEKLLPMQNSTQETTSKDVCSAKRRMGKRNTAGLLLSKMRYIPQFRQKYTYIFGYINNNISNVCNNNIINFGKSINFWLALQLFEESIKIMSRKINKVWVYLDTNTAHICLLGINSIIYSMVIVKLGEIWNSYCL